jgi:hypothetical protein
MAKNPHFRVLALTATPGSTPDAVQSLIDGLHISRIDIRDENSLDLKPFIHHKVNSMVFAIHLQTDRQLTSVCARCGKTIKQHIIQMTEDVDKVKDLLAKLMDVRQSFIFIIGFFTSSPGGHKTFEAAGGPMGLTRPSKNASICGTGSYEHPGQGSEVGIWTSSQAIVSGSSDGLSGQ